MLSDINLQNKMKKEKEKGKRICVYLVRIKVHYRRKLLYVLCASSNTETMIKFDYQDGQIKNVYVFIARARARDLFSRGLVIPFNGFSFIDEYGFERCHFPYTSRIHIRRHLGKTIDSCEKPSVLTERGNQRSASNLSGINMIRGLKITQRGSSLYRIRSSFRENTI